MSDTNATFLGLTCFAYGAGFGYSYVKGPCWQRDISATAAYSRGNNYHYKGKKYFEFNYALLTSASNDIKYQFGLVSPECDISALLGEDGNSWVFETETIEFIHDGGRFAAPSSFNHFKNFDDNRHGWLLS